MTSPLRRKRPTTVRGRNTPTWRATRYAWPLAVLAALVACGFASAQKAPALPPQPLPLPAQYTLPTPPVSTFSTAGVEQVGMQPPRPGTVPVPAPSPADTASSEYEELLRLPG